MSTLWLLPTSPTKLHVFIELILVHQPMMKITPQNQENSGGEEHVLGKCVRVRCELIAKSPTLAIQRKNQDGPERSVPGHARHRLNFPDFVV